MVPAARQEEGFEGVLLLVRKDGSGFYQSQVAKFRDRIVGHPRREIYRVAVARGIRGGIELLEEA